MSGGSAGSPTLTMEGFSSDKTVKPLIAQGEKDNPGVTGKFTGLPYPQILTQINTQLVSGTAPDIMTVFPGLGNPITVQTLAKSNYLADLTAQSWTSDFNSSRQQIMGVGGKVFLASNNVTIIPATYNQQALTAVGATLDGILTQAAGNKTSPPAPPGIRRRDTSGTPTPADPRASTPRSGRSWPVRSPGRRQPDSCGRRWPMTPSRSAPTRCR